MNEAPVGTSIWTDSRPFRYFNLALAVFSSALLAYALTEIYRGVPEFYSHQRASGILIPITNILLALGGAFKATKLKATFSVLGFLMSLAAMYFIFGDRV